MDATRWVMPPLIALAGAAAAAPVPAPELAEAQLRAIHQRALQAQLVRADAAFMEALVEPGSLHTGPDGRWDDRAAYLQSLPQALHGAAVQELRVRLFGPVALLHALVETLPADGSVQAHRSTEVYRWDGAAWRLAASQRTPLRTPAARRVNSAPAPVHGGWTGSDPSGEADAVLRALNESYVNAFREADVAWYDAHLAPDYLVISGDGTLHDRGAALVDFAKPTFATHIRSFPVGRVQVNRLGHVALIHAENAYELKDGRRGINRYVDIWVQGEAGWRCVAAHITVHQAPA